MWTNMSMINGFILIGVIAVCVCCYMLAKLYYDNNLNRIAFLHLLLSGSPEALTPEMLKDEVEKVKKSYELLKDYVK